MTTLNANVAPLHNKKPDYLDDLFSGEISNIELPSELSDGVIYSYAKSVSDSLEIKPATVFLQALACASSAFQCTYKTEYETGDDVPVGLYVVCEESPSAGKTRVQNLFLREYRVIIGAFNKGRKKQNSELDKKDVMPYAHNSMDDVTTAALSLELEQNQSG